jgi:CheY-like chemotaxis protein
VPVDQDQILLVEDDPDVRDALEEVLEDEGYVVAVAENGLEAVKLLLAHEPPALILLDLMMPVMDGYEFRRHQLADPRLATIPVIGISAGMMDDRIEAMQLAASIKKPLDLKALLEEIRRCCRPVSRG